MVSIASFLVLSWTLLVAPPETTYLGMYLQGTKIGFSSTTVSKGDFGNGATTKTDSKTVIDAGLLGAALKTTIVSTTLSDPSGRPKKMTFLVDSAGRTQRTEATFGETDIKLAIDNNGAKTSKTLELPKDAPVIDDVVSMLMGDTGAASKAQICYVLDPMTASLVKNTVKRLDNLVIEAPVGGKVEATVIEVSEPRATMRAFFTSKGDLLKIDGPMGIELLPISPSEALDTKPNEGPAPDLASATAIRPDKPIENAASAKQVSLLVDGADLALLPSDAFQTVSKQGSGWKVVVHPVSIDPKGTIAAAKKAFPQWTLPSLNIPSDTPEFKKLAAKVFGSAKTVAESAKSVRKAVFEMMKPNAGIGILRDAGEVLKTKEGVCRDYAVLTATILRAGGLPTRVASGLVYMNGQYYYHAWAEVWDTKKWVGVDSTLPRDGVGADHIKLAHGSVEEAFTFTFLDKVKVRVLDVRK